MLLFIVLKTALTKKNLFFLIPLFLCLVGAFIYYFSFVKIKPNDLIVTTSDGVALFSNENPEFKVDFGSKENPQGQIIRFEAQASNENPFEVEGKKSIFTIIAELFKPKSKVGIEMSLVGIDFSETGKTQNATLASNIQTVAEILGTDQVETSTNLIDMGREVGSLDTEESVSKPTIVNSNVANGIDLEYQILAGYGLKEEIVINDLEAYAESCGDGCSLPLNKFEFNLSVDDGVVLKKGWFTVEGQSTEIYYFVDGDGKYLAHFLPSYAVDKEGEKTYEVDLDIQEYSVGKFKAVVTVDSEWLLSGDRVYPIRIDPSIVHDDTSDFSGGIFNRAGSWTGPKISLDECTGGTVTYSDGYKIHTFTTGGTFSCVQNKNLEVLVVAGGGGGGGRHAGGGGGGGVRTSSNFPITSGDYSVTVGNGGAAGAYGGKGGNGGDSTFSTITATGGGGGGGYTGTAGTVDGASGGSGGGGAGATGLSGGNGIAGAGNTPATIPVQGYNGGAASAANYAGGGGGGAGGAGNAANGVYGGAGGIGTLSSISGIATYYGGGGGGAGDSNVDANGGAGGLGGGGRGTGAYYPTQGTAGTANTGGGGGGSRDQAGTTGGSGIVIVRYKSSPFGTYTSSLLNLSSATSRASISWLASGVNTGGGETPYSSTGLIAQWNFNETSGTTAVSGGTCGTSCNGTLTNMTTTGQDVATMTGWTSNNRRWGAGAVMFDGSNDYVAVTNAVDTPIKTGSYTISGWLNGSSFTNEFVLLQRGIVSTGGIYYGTGFYATSTGLSLERNVATATQYTLSYTTKFTPGQWYYVAATYDDTSGAATLYINGKSVSTSTFSTSDVSYHASYDQGYTSGALLRNVSNRYSNGILDTMSVYSRVLSSTEILSNYQVGNIEFQYRVSTNGSTWSSWTAYNDGALMFDGMDDYVSLGDVNSFDSLTELSTCAWVKHNSLTDDDHILSKVDSSTWSGFMFFRDDIGQETGRTDMYKVWVSKDTNAKWIEGATNSSVQGAWTHVCMTFKANDATGLRLYINGAEDANSPVSTVGLTTIDSGTTNLVIGRYDPAATNYINGSMDDLQVYSRVLTSSEVLSNYNTTSTGTPYSSASLYAHWSFDESNGTTANSSGEIAGLNGTLVNFSSTSGRDSLGASGWTSKSKRGSDTTWNSYDNQYLYGTSEKGLAAYWPLDEASGSGAYIKNALSSTPFATGGIVTYSGDYVIHTFLSSGVFTVNGGGNVDVLLVGGGGGGNIGRTNTYLGAGGGGGQVRILSSQSVTSGNINVTIGQGGAGLASTQIDINGNTGGATSFGALSASGGTGGYYTNGYGGTNGDGTHTGGAPSGIYAGGGGGAGANGQAGNSSTPKGGNGGAGIACDYSGSSVYYGGGGGAAGASGTRGEGGTGGGGAGSTTSSNSVAGTANTGGGGGAGGYTDHASSGGGSGIVIVRYPVYYIGAGSIQPVFSSVSGGTVTSSGGYTLHTFTSSGTLTVNGNGNVEVLVVGGGGGGGSGLGGGGGAGGVVYNASFNISTNAYTVTVGNGGGSNTSCNPGSSGGNSVFSTITAYGGGGGGGYSGYPVSGGSGGGSAGDGSYTGNGASGTANQGNSGGWGAGPSTYVAGGGGGAGAAGGNGSGTTSGSGGSGVAYAISGTSTYYGGGGGGAGTSVDNSRAAGSGGTGGGGAGNAASGGAGYSGTANTGGGGGGGAGGACNSGGSGGSGIVIVRYPSSFVAGSSSDGTPTGTTYVNGKFGGARSFNGSSDYIDVGNGSGLQITSSITVGAWVKLSSLPGSGVYTRIVSKLTNAPYNGYELLIRASNDGTYPSAPYFQLGNAGTIVVANSPTALTINTWYYIVGVYDQSVGTCYIYVNGVLMGQNASCGSSAIGSSSANVNIGRWSGNASNYFPGIIDEVRIFNTALSANTIASYYIQGISSNGSVYQQKTGGGVIKLEGTNSNRIANSLNDGLVSYWKLDESSGTSLADSVGTNTGSATGTSIVAGKYGNARNFNGSEYVTIGNLGSFPTQGSLEFWVRSSEMANYRNPLTTKYIGANVGIRFEENSSGNFVAIVGNDAGSYNSCTYISSGMATNTWYHITLTWNTSSNLMYGYLNGLQVCGGSNSYWPTTIPDFRLGTGYNADAARQWKGDIDEVKLFNVVKSTDEILEEYNATSTYYTNYNIASTDLSNKNTLPISFAGDKVGSYASVTWGESAYANYQTDANTIALWHLDEISGSGAYIKDSSGRNNNGTPTGTTYLSSGKIAGGRSFNGSSDYINVGAYAGMSPTAQVSVAAWLKSDSTISSIETVYDRLNSTQGYGLYINASGQAVFGINGSSATAVSSNRVDDLAWHYVVGRYNSGESGSQQIRIYVDGVLVGTGAYTTAISYSTEPRNQIGRMGTSSYFGGYIDELVVSNSSRTADQIRQAYEIGLRTHNITVGFGATLNSGNLISSSSDTSFTIDATTQGLSQMGSNLYVGDKIIVREVSSGTEYLAQGTVSAITAATGVTTVTSWDTNSTFPSGGFTTKASVFKWQTEYIPVKNRTIGTQVDATSLLTLRFTGAFGGRNIWIDDLRNSTGYISNSAGDSLTFPYEAGYLQYKAIITSQDSSVTPYLSQVQFDYSSGGPTMDQIMRHGKWFDSGTKKNFWWTGGQ